MRAVIVASGDLDAVDVARLDGAGLVVAADGGAGSLEAIGRRPDLLVGDLDSADPGLVERLRSAGTRIESHPADKEASDTELALEAVFAAGATEVILLGAIGGDRLDHAVANLMLLADPALAGRDVRLAHGSSVARALHGGGRLVVDGTTGDLVSLLPVGGDAQGITTDGLRWALTGATLGLGRSRGLSNEVTTPHASVRLERGTLLMIETSRKGTD